MVHAARRVPALVTACLGICLGAAATACTSDTTPVPTPAPSPSEPSAVRAPVVVRVGAGPVAVDVLVRGDTMDDPHVTVSRSDADPATVIFDLSDVPLRAPAALELASPGSFEVNTDGTVTVLDDLGTAVGGLTRPTPGGVVFAAVDATHVELTRPDEPVDVGEVSTRLGTEALVSTDWGDREGGRSLAVEPTDWARDAGLAGRAVAWAQIVAAEPDADSPGMYDQLVCHAIGAPDKATWNLEPWRPDVGLVAVMAARCNPAPGG